MIDLAKGDSETGGSIPVLYSFRRCPYAMRARLGLSYAGITCQLREVVLRDKPAEMVALSPKATVPVLRLPDGAVIDESYDIVKWAVAQHDPEDWVPFLPRTDDLVRQNDTVFKAALDKYKYASRHPGHPPEYYRTQGEAFLLELDQMLQDRTFLLADRQTVADIAVFPFVRQFAHVDKAWFFNTPYRALQRWLTHHLASNHFTTVMKKYPQWRAGDDAFYFPPPPPSGGSQNM